jgi:hypothetical protein
VDDTMLAAAAAQERGLPRGVLASYEDIYRAMCDAAAPGCPAEELLRRLVSAFAALSDALDTMPIDTEDIYPPGVLDAYRAAARHFETRSQP